MVVFVVNFKLYVLVSALFKLYAKLLYIYIVIYHTNNIDKIIIYTKLIQKSLLNKKTIKILDVVMQEKIFGKKIRFLVISFT